MIDLKKFAKRNVEKTIIPVCNQVASWKRRRLSLGVEDGWYLVETGSKPKVIRKATEKEIYSTKDKYKIVRGYSLQNGFIPKNYEEANKRFNIKPGRVVKVDLPYIYRDWIPTIYIVTKVGIVAGIGVDYSSSSFDLLKAYNAFENDTNLIGGVSPELRTVYALARIEKLQHETIARELALKRSREEMMKSLEGRLTLIVEEAGGTISNYKVRKNIIELDWEIEGIEMNSLIDRETFQCMEAGFCISGEDKKLRIDAAVVTAKEHIEKRILYKTRGRGQTGYVFD